MCRSIKTLVKFQTTCDGQESAPRPSSSSGRSSGFTRPSKANELAFDRAVDQVDQAVRELLSSLVTNASPRNRDAEAAKTRTRIRNCSAA